MGRAPCCDKANVKKGPWSPEEDATLKSHIQKHGTGGNWIALPHKIGLKRCGKSCRLRWLNYLRPDIKHGAFTEDEDNLICTLYSAIGSRWSIIAAQLPGRTDNDIKNYWNTRLKKKLLGKQRRSLEPPLQPPTSDLPLILEPDLCYCNDYLPQQNILEPNLQQQNLWENSACSSFQFMMDSSSINLEEGMYAANANANAMAPQLDAAAITACSSSPLENVSWGDTHSNSVDSLIYPQQTLANYQHFTLFDDPRLLGFSQ